MKVTAKINTLLGIIRRWSKWNCPKCGIETNKEVDEWNTVTRTCNKCGYEFKYNDSYP